MSDRRITSHINCEKRIAELEADYSDVVAEHENELALRLEAEAENKRLRGIIHGESPDHDSPEWEPWVNTVIGRCPYHHVELTRGSWHMHLHCPRERY
jgi:hypothetical protein